MWWPRHSYWIRIGIGKKSPLEKLRAVRSFNLHYRHYQASLPNEEGISINSAWALRSRSLQNLTSHSELAFSLAKAGNSIMKLVVECSLRKGQKRPAKINSCIPIGDKQKWFGYQAWTTLSYFVSDNRNVWGRTVGRGFILLYFSATSIYHIETHPLHTVMRGPFLLTIWSFHLLSRMGRVRTPLPLLRSQVLFL